MAYADSDTQALHRGPSRRVLAAGAAGLTAVAVAAAVVVSGDDPAPAPAPAAPPAVAAPPVADVASEPAMTAPAGSTEIPTFPPAGVTWSLFRGYALPSSPDAGPARVDGALAEGYAHTPTGALLAAANIDVRALLAKEQWREVIDRQVVPSAAKDRYVQMRSQLPDDVPAGDLAQIIGFRFTTYSPEVAVIELARRSASGQLQATSTTVRWTGEDWRLEFPATNVEPYVIPSLVGFVPWSGVA